LVVAYEAAKRLKWDIGFLKRLWIHRITKISMISWSEEVQVKIEVGQISIKSECSGSQWMDWGKEQEKTLNYLHQHLLKSIWNKWAWSRSEVPRNSHWIQWIRRWTWLSLSKKETITGFFSLLKPTEGYFYNAFIGQYQYIDIHTNDNKWSSFPFSYRWQFARMGCKF